jgi:Protein of unknown function (DUF3667)
MPVCNNCSLPFEGNYCSHCGQKASVGRLRMHEIVHDLVHAVTHAEKGIVRLAKELLFFPGKLYAGYFSGKRKTYFSPVAFFLLLMGLALFFGDKLIRYEGAVAGRSNQFELTLFSLQKIRYLVFIPLISLLTLAFFHKRFNLAECLAFWFLCMGMVVLVELISYLFQFCFIHIRHPIQYYTDWLVFILILVHLFAVFPKGKIVNNFICVLLGLSTYFLLVYIYKFLGHLKGFEADFNFWHIIQQVFS